MNVRGVRAGAGVGAGEHEPALSCSPWRPLPLLLYLMVGCQPGGVMFILCRRSATPTHLTLLPAVCPGLEFIIHGAELPTCVLLRHRGNLRLGYLRPWGLTPRSPSSLLPPADHSHPQAPSAGEVLFPGWLVGVSGASSTDPAGCQPHSVMTCLLSCCHSHWGQAVPLLLPGAQCEATGASPHLHSSGW